MTSSTTKITINRKSQEDRLLKQLNPVERRQQEQLRRIIKEDKIFKII
jgi:hypothetical protein